MSGKTPPPPSPDAPPPAAKIGAVALSLLAPPSPSSPASPRRAGAGNLFCDASEKQVSDLVSMGYSPAKRRVGRRTRGASSSPRNAVILADDASSDDSSNEDYSTTPIVHITQPKKRESKVTLDSSFFLFLCPATFDTQMLSHGHPPVYSKEAMNEFGASFQKQLSFNFCARRASRKKWALILESCASRLCEINLDLTAPASFSLKSSDRHELSRYVLEDLLSCPVGSCLIVCIRVGATGNPTKLS